ncbi:phosphotransferase [Cladorrhinum samala]|uniref:Altered inheritance of mitochondria protein 9, mitochondrial n=1 Tax=Cladorrhinum samala TaxID=585594 RepID=A0AAV9HW42_9PEZI|nr:phosphotransferase [Cladorrhinum samala]
MSTARPDWNNDLNLFAFTRGRFVFDEARQMQQRTVRFDMNRLAQIAASSIGAESCIAVTKCPDGMYTKAYILRMSDGREVIAKVPNPNAGVPHYTTASEVATIDFVREVLKTPAPKVHAWSSRAGDNGVGAEYIIMEKAQGEPLDRFWDRMSLSDKLKVLMQVLSYNQSWLAFPFPGYGSLYYESDAGPSSLAVGKGFAIGPAIGRDWHDADRSSLQCDRGPWASALTYRTAIAARERAAIQRLPPAKQMVLITGPPPELYMPTPAKKLSALAAHDRLLPRILPTADPVLASPFLWHDDLHGENVFVDPSDPTRITAVIDWQGVQVAPLFDHNAAQPAFLDYSYASASENENNTGGQEDDMTPPPPPDTSAMSEPDRAAALTAYADLALSIAWRRLVRKKAPALDDLAKFQESTEGNVLHVARRVYEVGESLLAGLALDLEPSGDDEAVTTIRSEMDAASTGVDLMGQLQEQMGEDWPDKGLTTEKDYQMVKAMLSQARDQMAEGLFGEDEAKRDEFKRAWPFDE